MNPQRKTEINGNKIEEFYWNGEMVVYVNDRRTDRTYDEEVRRETIIANNEKDKNDADPSYQR